MTEAAPEIAAPPERRVATPPKPVVETPKSMPPVAVKPPEPMQDMFPFNDTHKAPAIEIDFPALPDALPDLPGRLIGHAPTDSTAIWTKAAQIAPLLDRLEVLRDRMRSQ
jgi:hypothetical protein